MKKILLLSVTFLCSAASTYATQYMVMVANYSFTPASFNMHMGDTIMWMWSAGTHTTTSTTIPSGATTWNANINASATTFMYVPNKEGTYNYQCNFHASLGMVGSFTVLAPTGVPAVTVAAPAVYPNPTTGVFHLQFGQGGEQASVMVSDVAGRTVYQNVYSGMQAADVNLADMPNGLYIVTVMQNNSATKQELIVSH